MILRRESRPNLFALKEEPESMLQLLLESTENKENENHLTEMIELMQLYTAAMKEVSTKLEILDDEFQLIHKHNPIHHMECRRKDITSIMKKVKKYSDGLSIDSIRKNVKDIAGIRVICNFIDDIYEIEK